MTIGRNPRPRVHDPHRSASAPAWRSSLAGSSLDAVGWTLRSLPTWIRGKHRVAAIALRQAARLADIREVAGGDGLRYVVPSLDEPIVTSIVATGYAEPATIEALDQSLPHDGLLFDVGANIGGIALPLARRRPDARIRCFEPSRLAFDCLVRNIDLNGLVGRVSAEPLALADSSRNDVPFYAPEEGFGRASFSALFTQTPELVAVASLDELLDGEGRGGSDSPDLLKVDVEGYEWHVFRGASRLLAARAPAVVFEFCDWAERLAGREPGDAQRLLMELGYRLRRLDDPSAVLIEPMVKGFAMILATKTPRDVAWSDAEVA